MRPIERSGFLEAVRDWESFLGTIQISQSLVQPLSHSLLSSIKEEATHVLGIFLEMIVVIWEEHWVYNYTTVLMLAVPLLFM